MKLFHLADLHLGRRVGEFSLIEDQRYILEEILKIADAEQPDGVLIAGDVYDKSLPSAEAVTLFDDFLTALAKRKLSVFIVSGNHDSPERLAFGSRLLAGADIHIAGVFSGAPEEEVRSDAFGKVHFFLLPFIKPSMVRQASGQPAESYDAAVREALSAVKTDSGERNVLVAHQFVTYRGEVPERCDSESVAVGGLDNVEASAFDAFDYAALGHLHGPQRIGRDTVRYAGSPLKYSFSEARQRKSITVVELGEKGGMNVRLLPLAPLRDMREIKGPIERLLRAGEEDGAVSRDYIRATLTDEGGVYDAVGKLREVYPNLMHIDFENSRTKETLSEPSAPADTAGQMPAELFEAFYRSQNGAELTEDQRRLMADVFAEEEGKAQ